MGRFLWHTPKDHLCSFQTTTRTRFRLEMYEESQVQLNIFLFVAREIHYSVKKKKKKKFLIKYYYIVFKIA